MRASTVLAIERFIKVKHEPGQRIVDFLDWFRTGPKSPGRPPGSQQYDDELHLIEMGRVLETGEVGTLHRAATTVVHGGQVFGASVEAKIKRLSEAFKLEEIHYRRLGREKIDGPAHNKT